MWLDWACDRGVAGNVFRLQLEDQKLTGRAPGTGTWDLYRHDKFGRLELPPPGRHKLTFDAEGPIRNCLLDLREVQLVPADRPRPPRFDAD